ncbi:STY0301 family protein [Azospirillum picis]|uniref:Secreted protein n=1 Tax=Azospirillum picis TaxID=488438 RepID=A0ABU0MG39_9PROT|nr:STY0301 family protein [Azospirillum picis]MBP2298554.1 hypothetical protein [Azospirillum picis]MDQ0532397.1 hypothetical protein [Azospirillum picis]
MRPIFVMALAAAAAATPALAEPPDCPPTLAVQSQPEAPGGWSPYAGKDSHALAGVTLVEGDRKTLMAADSPPALPPDRELRRTRSLVQVWEFHGARREEVFVICRYRDTAATLAADLPRVVRRCTLTRATDLRGTVLDDPASPPRLDCR